MGEQKLWDTFIPQGPRLSESEKQVNVFLVTPITSTINICLYGTALGLGDFQCN